MARCDGGHARDGAVAHVADLVLGADPSGSDPEPLFVPREEDARPAAGGQATRDGEADACRAAGDDRDRQSSDQPQTRTVRELRDSCPPVFEATAVRMCGPFFAPPVRQTAR
jgi:hypothetical protein